MGDGSADERPRSRSVLGDVTNQLGKRRFVSIPGNSDNLKNVENESGNAKFARKISSGVENPLKGKHDSESVADDDKIEVVSTKANESCGSLNLGSNNTQFPKGKAVSSVSGFPSEIKEFSGLFDGNRLIVLGSKGETVNAATSDKAITTNVCENKIEGTGGDDLTVNKSGSIGSPIRSGSSVPKVPETRIGTGFDNTDCSNASTDMTVLKNCSCSFCIKASYIWSDLHYQDAKCRLSAIKKSRKEFRSEIEKYINGGVYGNSGQECSNKSTNLESDLLGQWRSLFLHTDTILDRECTQLQSSILKLEELREDCKADLEMLHPTTSNL